MKPELLHDALDTMRQLGIREGVDLWTNAVMVAEALDRSIEVRAGTRQRLLLVRGRRRYRWMDGATNFNTLLAIRCAKQKEVTSRLLKSSGVHAPENAVFSPANHKRAYAWAEAILPVVVKPYNGNQGRGVHMNLNDYPTFCSAFKEVAEGFGDVLVEEQLTGVEHRVLTVAGRVVAATRRIPAHVMGDGHHTVSELIGQKNADRGRIHKKIQIDNRVQRQLTLQAMTLQDIPHPNSTVVLHPTSNLHTGGDAIDATGDLTAEEVQLVEKSASAIPGLRLAGIDTLLPDNSQTGRPAILEVNPSPMISMHHFPWRGEQRNVAGAILAAMFPEGG